MSEQDENEQNDEQTTTDEQAAPSVEDLQRELAAAQQHARKQEAIAKQNAAAARRLQQMEEANKSEQQKAADAAAAAEARASKAELELLRLRIGSDKGLTLAQSRRLVGTSEDELRTDADALLDEIKPNRATTTRKPAEELRGGSAPDEPAVEMDPVKLAEQITNAR